MKRLLIFLCLAATASALDFNLTSSGPQHVTRGHYMFFQVTGTVTSGVDESATPAVSGLPVGVTASFPNQIKYCCGTTVYTITGDNPVRLDAAANATLGTYIITVTYTSTSGVVRKTNPMIVVDAVPAPIPLAAFATDTPLTGLATWQANMLSYGTSHCTSGELTTYEGFAWYYDGTRNYYQIADYTNNHATWDPCARMFDDFFQAYVNTNGGNIQGWRNFAQGLAMGYLREGKALDKTAVLALQSNGYANFGNVALVIDYLLSREISYGLNTHLQAEVVGNPRHPNFQNVVEILFGHFDQWFLSKRALYTQPFMVALAAEAMIAYYDATGDARVPPLLKLAADRLWADSFDPLTTSLMYYNNNGTTTSPYDVNCTNGVTTPCKGPSPDLNLLIVPLFGWVYQHTGLRIYRDEGDQLFNAGVSGAYLTGGKQFTQNYRWSGKYVTWRNAPLGGNPLAPTVTMTCTVNP